MESPSSTRRVTRSQTMAASGNNSNLLSSWKVEESENTLTKSRKKSAQKQKQHQDRSALIDITNDSPIVGLAMGSLKTPSSAMSKNRGQVARTPGSGEALLRGQVKTLLQKVEEEADLTLENNRPFFNTLVAPTPANTPQILSDHIDVCLTPSLTPAPADDKFLIPQMMISEMLLDDKNEESGIESENVITRSLLFDFSEKSSDSSKCSSVLTYQGAFCCGESNREKVYDDDALSVWSIQVNASSNRDDQEEECDSDKNDDGVLLLHELCEGISKISVKEEEAPKFMAKHIRFVYNSDDDEIEGEEKVFECESSSSPSSGGGMLRLEGLPTPKGKHIRFS